MYTCIYCNDPVLFTSFNLFISVRMQAVLCISSLDAGDDRFELLPNTLLENSID